MHPDPTEQWRPVVGYEGSYSVSNLGRIRRDAPGSGAVVGRILRQKWLGRYLGVAFGYHRGEQPTNHYVADMVMAAFVGQKPDGLTVNHIDGDKTNNRRDNLEYATYAEQRLHALNAGLAESHPNLAGRRGRLSNEQIAAIRARRLEGATLAQLVTEFGISMGYASMLVRGLAR